MANKYPGSVLDYITGIFEQAGIPTYVWLPIARQESGLDPNSHNTSGEDSRGLFQINLNAHPEYATYDLFDPVVNATIAARDFIGPAWADARSLFSDPGEQAAYVWRYGIRPDWPGVVARGADQALMTDARQIAAGQGWGERPPAPGYTPGPNDWTFPLKNPFEGGLGFLNPSTWGEKLQTAGMWVVFALALILLVVLGVSGVGKAFGAEPLQAVKKVVS